MEKAIGIIYPNKAPTAEGFRAMFSSALLDGIVSGVTPEVRTSGAECFLDLHRGFYHCAGGEVLLTDTTTLSLGSRSVGFWQVVAKIDTSIPDPNPANPDDEVPQFDIRVIEYNNMDEVAAAGLRKPSGFNENGGIYESEVCLIDCSLKRLIRVNYATPKLSYGTRLPGVAQEGTVFLLKV